MSFEDTGLDQALIQALADRGYTSPTPIQEAAISPVLDGHDVMASAPTGTGKTAAFTLPILQGLSEVQKTDKAKKYKHPRVLILTPTRELAAQVLDSVEHYSRHIRLNSLAVFGGVKIGPQINRLKQGVDIIVATPGRLMDLYQQQAIKLDYIETFVLDEADRMLDMGFISDIRKIQKLLPDNIQRLMFSATFSPEIRTLANGMLNRPVVVEVAKQNSTAVTVEQCVITVDKQMKAQATARLYEMSNQAQTLVFTRTKHGADKLVRLLKKSSINAAAIHGNKSQNHRNRVLSEFKNHKLDILVATDIASRGLDIKELPVVINYDLPEIPEDYVHRIGRTGRAGRNGLAVSLVCADEAKKLHAIEKLTSQEIARDELEGLEPEVVVPFRRADKPAGSKPKNGGKRRRPRRQRQGNQRKAG